MRSLLVRFFAAITCTLSPPLPPICDSCSQSADDVASHGSLMGTVTAFCSPSDDSCTTSSLPGGGVGPGSGLPLSSSVHAANASAVSSAAPINDSLLNFFITVYALFVDDFHFANKTCFM